MSDSLRGWRSSSGEDNAIALRYRYAPAFDALAEFDRLGHLMLHRATEGPAKDTIESLVGIALLRRAVTIFAGLRHLLEASLVDPSVVLARTYFEIWLQYRTLAYGTTHPISLETQTSPEDRDPRARRFYVASVRRGLRSRALIVGPEARHAADTSEGADRLAEELRGELARLRIMFPDEWEYFGDLSEDALVRRLVGREEPAWYADLIQPKPSHSIEALAGALGQRWQYDFLYEAWSAFAHGRGISKDVNLEGSRAEVNHPHRPTWFTLIAYLALSWHGMLLMTAAKWFYPEMIPQLQQLHAKHSDAIQGLEPDETIYNEFID